MSPSPPNLSLVFSLAPKDAIDYFEAKGLKLNPEGWASVRADSHAKAFTVSRMTRLDLLQDIRTAIDDAISKGTTFAEFQRTLTPTLKARGWWGIDPDTGVQLGSPHRLATIFRTNVQTSYMEGRWRGIMEGVETHPWIKYIAILDGRTRPAHRLLNGKVFRYDDPFWQRFRPPLGWNCRCRMTSLSDKDLQRQNLRPESSTGRIEVNNVQAQGYPQPQATFLDPVTGNTVKTDIGWGYDRLKGWTPDPDRYGSDLKPIFKKITQEPKAIAQQKTYIPVGNALILPKSGQVFNVAKSVLSVIDQVHSDGVLPKIPIKNGGGKFQGCYSHYRNGDSIAIVLNTRRSVNYELTMAHEIGHFIDHHGFGQPGTWSSELDAEFAGWRAAVRESKATKALETIKSGVDRKEIRNAAYYLKPLEQWARSYAQWLALKSQNKAMLDQIERILGRKINTAYQASQWDNEDFQHIADEIDKIFEAKGWLK